MAVALSALTIVSYLKTWDAANRRLEVDLLIVPVGDPRLPLTQGWPGLAASKPFEGANIEIVAHLGTDVTIIPNLTDLAPTSLKFRLMAPPQQSAIFAELASTYKLVAPQIAPQRSGRGTLRKYLPTSYRSSFGFTGPSTELAVTDDSYHCARRCPPDSSASDVPMGEEISWGDAYAMLLRQPEFARAAGLIHTVSLDVGAQFENGGWLFFSLATGSEFQAQAAANPDFLRVFGTRVPELTHARPVFTSVLFPIGADALAASAFGPMDEVFQEAVEFDDGFAKIVHASQARTADHSEDGANDFQLPLKDMGIRLGWDDESVVVRLDRSLSEKKPDGTALPLAPTGAAGYRIDVRKPGGGWNSLNAIDYGGVAFGAALIRPFSTELMVEVHPSQLGTQFWVPPYYTYWRGNSLVADTKDQIDIESIQSTAPMPYQPSGHENVSLRYGEAYEFRVRMANAVGGGPSVSEIAQNPAAAPVASLRFRRYVPLGAVSISEIPNSSPLEFSVKRPPIGYPEAQFAGGINALARLAAKARANRSTNIVEALSIPDPDAIQVELRVMVLMPNFDPTGETVGFRELYRTSRDFPALGSDGEEVAPLTIQLNPIDCPRLKDVTWSSSSGPLDVPTARTVRVEVRALGRDDPNYFGSDQARFGTMGLLTSDPLYFDPQIEPDLFETIAPSRALASVFLQPDPVSTNDSQTAVVQSQVPSVLVTRLAQATELTEDDGVLLPEAGQRMIFGCRGLKHIIAPDFSSLQLTAWSELPNRWINVLRVPIARDWSWQGYANSPFRVSRTITLIDKGEVFTKDLGVIGLQHTISLQARRGEVDRERFEICLIDAFEAPLGNDGLPYEIQVRYEITAELRVGAPQVFKATNNMPITQAPRQIPKIVSTGHAFSDYRILGDYEETGNRDRVLWVEFAEPLADPRDSYFARMLYSTPDPMLLPATEPMADPPAYDKRPLDAELVRVVRPEQAQDLAGLTAMVKLTPCMTAPGEKPRHFLLRPPASLTAGSPELFGMFSYEFAVGHDRGSSTDPLWVTAQGRYGTSLILEGLQHPVPPLPIDFMRDKALDRVHVSSEFARAVKNGEVLTANPPNTQIWVVAYARVQQADGQGWRNIQLGRRQAVPLKRSKIKTFKPAAISARAQWSGSEIRDVLSEWGLPSKTPMGFLAVELLPEPNGRFEDPLGGDLGQVRILRSSRLISVGDTCCL